MPSLSRRPGLGDRCRRRMDKMCIAVLLLNAIILIFYNRMGSSIQLIGADTASCQNLILKWRQGVRGGQQDFGRRDEVSDLLKDVIKGWEDVKNRIDDVMKRDAAVNYLNNASKMETVKGGSDVRDVRHEESLERNDHERRDKILEHFQEQQEVKDLCPLVSRGLEGNLSCKCEPITPKELQTRFPELKDGRLMPTDCIARERLAIIIPYRDRFSHLHVLLDQLIPILKKQQADVTFFVVEQAGDEPFNRALLHNVGFLESAKVGSFDCYVFHDVDLVPMNDNNFYRCAANPRLFAAAIQRYGKRKPRIMYHGYFGGVVGFSKAQYLDVNGNSNLYFGWGGEDDDLLLRTLNKAYKHVRLNTQVYHYRMLKHERNDRKRGNVDRKLLLTTAEDRQDMEGLSTTKYKLNDAHYEPLYVWINVSMNVTEILQTAPDFTMDVLKPRRPDNVAS
ncbi:unnamed protein product [Lymnaea stagnalis]|uniref:Beta-1,4-galactosyltransferase n=1 Tax=Lymnaea stagnalis TaxID=6523 RepID=A0AAV2H9H3_LYMST